MSKDQKLRIAQMTDTFLPVVDGVGRVALAYAQELCALGHEVSVVTPLYDTGHRGGLPFEIIDFLAYKVPTANQYRTGPAIADAHYRKRISQVQLDIVHAHGPFSTGREALRIARQRKIPLIASFHSKYYDDFLKATKSESIAKLAVSSILSFYEKCDQVWAVSEPTADVLRSYGFQGPVQVMPNGVSLREAKQEDIARLQEGWPIGEDPVLLFVGQMNWKKNILRILEACAVLHAQEQRFHLVFAGQGPDEEEIRQKAEELGIQDHCLFMGHVADAGILDALYHSASLFCFPSLYDNAPMVVREAAVMGTPSVLVRGSDAAVVVEDGVNGFLCEDQSEDLARVIQQALSDPERLQAIGKAAQQSIPVPWHQIMLQVAEAYAQAIWEAQGTR